ncbi:MAG TPA: asparagine synthase (glutamine-hydrolyzing) [Bacilli bacterium]|nr:asparagine synthase (glutamine-hydrolyzing) [Bacilli bacterium]HQC83458.1 asparagine synthase (glutamine-hydrolyzing) [Bacilli bacterium]
MITMCGIVGFVGNEKNKKQILKDMADRIAHRGPDAQGFYIDGSFALAQRRLSIIDIEGGKQPMISNNENVVIVYNGEAYNYKELKKELTSYDFKTDSDTEVLIAGYEKWGHDLPKHLRGMFAFAIYDKKRKELFCARDPFGVKPLYYYFNKETKTLMFASEIKAFLDHPSFKREFNDSILPNYLRFSFTPTTETFFKGVNRLDAGCYLVYKEDKLEITRYFELSFNEKKEDFEKTADKVATTMKSSVEHHMIADVEVGSFLSSGVDSSYLVALARPDKTYTAGYNIKKYDETSYVKDLTNKLNINNKVVKIGKKEYMNSLDKIMYYLDEPSSDPAIVSLYFVAQLASKDVKVVLSGEGADEFFGGYNTYRTQVDYMAYDKIPFPIRHGIAKVLELLPPVRGVNYLIRHGEKVEDRYVGVNPIWEEREVKHLCRVKPAISNADIIAPYLANFKDKNDLIKMQVIDIKFWLQKDILLKADRMTMANSIEGRVPFTDVDVFKLASSLPTEYKVTKQNTKVVMREAAKKAIPTEVYNKKKLGFPVPVRDWMRDKDVYEDIKKEFNSDIANKYFNTKLLIKLLDEHYNNKHDNYRKVWSVYTFLKWYNVFFA